MNKSFIFGLLFGLLSSLSKSYSMSTLVPNTSFKSSSPFQSHNRTTNSTTQKPIDKLTPLVITCAVLAQVLLPFMVLGCIQGFKACCMREKRRVRKQLGESLLDKYECLDPCCRVSSLHYYFFFFFWFAYLISYNALDLSKYGVVYKNLHIMSIVVIIFSFLFVLMESYLSRELDHLDHPMQKSKMVKFMRDMRERPPVIVMSVECYHYEQRRRTLGEGEGTKTEKIVTHTGSRSFVFDSWEDISSDEVPWENHPGIIRFEIDAFFEFADKETEQEFEYQKQRYYNSYKRLDEHMNFDVKYSLPGLDYRIIIYDGVHQTNSWISKKYFWCWSIFCMTWPYRWLFVAKTTKCRYVLRKKMTAKSGAGDRKRVEEHGGFDVMAFLHGQENYNPFPKDSPPVRTRCHDNSSMFPSDALRTVSDTDGLSENETNKSNEAGGSFHSLQKKNCQPVKESSSKPSNQNESPLLPFSEPDFPPPCYDVAIGS